LGTLDRGVEFRSKKKQEGKKSVRGLFVGTEKQRGGKRFDRRSTIKNDEIGKTQNGKKDPRMRGSGGQGSTTGITQDRKERGKRAEQS